MRLHAWLLALPLCLSMAGCNCGSAPLFAEPAFPRLTVAPAGDQLLVRAGHGAAAEPGLAVSLSVSGGTALPTSGVTDAQGEFRATIAPGPLPAKAVGVQVTVSDGVQAPLVVSLDAGIADLGLLATYSTGQSFLEGPVRHGWASECGTTGNNLYQDVCVAVSASPVNWAFGTFSVAWTGLLRAPATGDVYFQSYAWVDGVVHVVVDGTVVADLDTTGGGYSKVVPLDAGTWVPVSMTFAGNGGSNNMHLGWGGGGATTIPAGAWVPVPRSNLATPR